MKQGQGRRLCENKMKSPVSLLSAMVLLRISFCLSSGSAEGKKMGRVSSGWGVERQNEDKSERERGENKVPKKEMDD